MERETTTRLIGLTLFLALLVVVLFTLTPAPVAAANAWQEQQLYRPGPAQLERESRGLLTIYSGFTDLRVASAMEQQFDRVEHMMFVDTVVTAADGKPERGEESGEVKTEDDGC